MSRLAFRLNRLAQFAQLVAYSSTLPALVLGICLAFAEPAPAKADDVALCDALASEDAARAPVVPLNSIDADKATAACSAALAAQPTDAAIVHQYARALERAGRTEDARRLYDWAASDSYAPAVAALVRLLPA